MRNCYEYQEMISRLLDEELSAEEAQALHAHMRECVECRRMHDAFSALSASIAEDMEEPPAELAAGVMFKVRNAVPAPKKRRFKIGHYAAMAACLAIVILAASQSDLLRGGMHKSLNAEAESISILADDADAMLPVPMPDAKMDGGVEFAPEEPRAMDDSDYAYYAQSEDSSEAICDSVAAEPDAPVEPEAPDCYNETVEAQTQTSALPETLTYNGQKYRLTGTTTELPKGSTEAGTVETIFPTDASVIDSSVVSPQSKVFASDNTIYLLLTTGIYAVYQIQ